MSTCPGIDQVCNADCYSYSLSQDCIHNPISHPPDFLLHMRPLLSHEYHEGVWWPFYIWMVVLLPAKAQIQGKSSSKRCGNVTMRRKIQDILMYDRNQTTAGGYKTLKGLIVGKVTQKDMHI